MKEAIARFVATAREYCAWVERSPGPSDLCDAHRLVSRLHADAVSLPDDVFSGAGIPHNEADDALVQWKAVRPRFHDLPLQYYRELFDPLAQETEEPVQGDLADDLTDIYLDVKQGLLAYDRGHEQHAVWCWRFHWTIHWGEHATSALRALYWFERNRQ